MRIDTDIQHDVHPSHRRIAEAIRSARIARGWTQADLSHYSRLSPGDISRIETGRLIPSRGQRQRLSDALGIVLPPLASDDAAAPASA